jgi:phage gp36-like protein
MALFYASVSDLGDLLTERELYEITTESGDTPEEEILLRALERAERVVDSKIGVRYSTPALASDGSVLMEINQACISVARYLLYSRRVPPDHVRLSYEDTMRWLNDVSMGRAVINLMAADGNESTTATAAFGSASRSGVALSSIGV